MAGEVSRRMNALEALADTKSEENVTSGHHRPELHGANTARLPTRLPSGSRKKVSFFSAGPEYGLPRLSDQIPRPTPHAAAPSGSSNQIKEQRPNTSTGVGGEAWRRWFRRHREAFRSLAVRIQVCLQEQSTKLYHDASDSGTTRKPDRLTTQTLVRLLKDLSNAPGEMGQMQRTLNREILRCIFYDFSEDGAQDGPLRRSYHEIVFFLEKQLKRMRARVRFFLQETETR